MHFCQVDFKSKQATTEKTALQRVSLVFTLWLVTVEEKPRAFDQSADKKLIKRKKISSIYPFNQGQFCLFSTQKGYPNPVVCDKQAVFNVTCMIWNDSTNASR